MVESDILDAFEGVYICLADQKKTAKWNFSSGYLGITFNLPYYGIIRENIP
jgi:hypothetical protein